MNKTELRQQLKAVETDLAWAERAVAKLRALAACNSMYHNENIADWGCCYTCGEGVRS